MVIIKTTGYNHKEVEMTWNYRLAKNKDDLYGIVEVYYDKEGQVTGWTQDFIDPNYWEDAKGVKNTLQKMLEAFDKPLFEEVIK